MRITGDSIGDGQPTVVELDSEKELDAERAGRRWRVLARVADDPVTPAEGVLAAESAPLIS